MEKQWADMLSVFKDLKRLTDTGWKFSSSATNKFFLSHDDYGIYEFHNHSQLKAFLGRWLN